MHLLPLLALTPAYAQSAPAFDAEALTQALVALEDHNVRKARLTAELGAQPQVADRLGAALSVVDSLQKSDRNDPFVVRLFLQAALSEDPATRQAAVTSASQGGDPPTGVVAQVPALPAAELQPMVLSAPDPALLRKYKQRRLQREVFAATFVSVTPTLTNVQTVNTWVIRRGGTTEVPPMDFAKLVHDRRATEHLERVQRNGRIWTGVTLGGLGAMAAGLVIMAVPPPACSGSNCPDFHPATFPLLIGGGVLAIVGAGPMVMTTFPLAYPSKTWTPDRADALIDGYNDKLRTELGLTPEDTQKIDGL